MGKQEQLSVQRASYYQRNFFAKNSRQGIIPVLGRVLRTHIKDLYYDSTVFHNTGPVCKNLSSLVIML